MLMQQVARSRSCPFDPTGTHPTTPVPARANPTGGMPFLPSSLTGSRPLVTFTMGTSYAIHAFSITCARRAGRPDHPRRESIRCRAWRALGVAHVGRCQLGRPSAMLMRQPRGHAHAPPAQPAATRPRPSRGERTRPAECPFCSVTWPHHARSADDPPNEPNKRISD